jgi:putative ABC transport system permease protein
MSVYRVDDFTLAGQNEPEHVLGGVVSANLFTTLGVQSVLGRSFAGEEDAPTATGLPVVLSHRLWQNRFGSDPKTVGRSITLEGRDFTVVGVMPPQFQFPVQRQPVDFWTTIALDLQPTPGGAPPLASQRGVAYLDVIARLKPQVSRDRAQSELDAIQQALNRQHPEDRPSGISLVPELNIVVGDMRQGLFMLFGAVGFVLLIACANVANLLLARATSRKKEIGIRGALGASRWAIVRQLVTESVTLSLLGAALGLLLTLWGVNSLTRLAPSDLPRITESAINLKVLGFTTLVALAAGIGFGLVPALQASKLELTRSLNEGGRSGTESAGRRRTRSGLIVTEIALAMMLLVGAGLFLRSLQQLRQVDPGFVPAHTVTFGIDLYPNAKYGQAKRVEFYQQLLERIRTAPGIRSATATLPLPLDHNGIEISFEIEGRPVAASQRPVTALGLIGSDYFHTMGIPLINGRDFGSQDTAGSTPVVIVNQALARRFFAGENPVGKLIKPDISSGKADADMRQIVGVVGDVRFDDLNTQAAPQVYVPYAQLPFAPMAVVVRTDLALESAVPTLSNTVRSLDKDLPLLNVKTLDEYVDGSIAGARFNTLLLGIFAGLALCLTVVGLYGVVSYSVMQRMAEMGIRIALGAQYEDILRMILREGMILCFLGVSAGLAGSLLLARLIASMLYGVRATDAGTFTVIALLLVVVALFASYIPARRAAKADPMTALRYE